MEPTTSALGYYATEGATIRIEPSGARGVPLLSRATPLIGHFQIRNRGAIGGSFAHADAAAEYPGGGCRTRRGRGDAVLAGDAPHSGGFVLYGDLVYGLGGG